MLPTTPPLPASPRDRDRPLTVRLARWSATHPWRAIGMWLAFVAVCVAAGGAVPTHQANDLDLGTGQSGRAAHLLHDSRLDPAPTENVLVTARSGRLAATTAHAALTDVTARMRGLPQVTGVGAVTPSRDGQAETVTVTLARNADDGDIGPLLDATSAVQHRYPALRVEQVGDISLNKAVNDRVNKDLSAAASFSLPVTLLILLIAFGAILAAGVPVLLALSAVASATGLSALASHVIPDSGSTSSMILLMGMAVGVDYSLFYVKRARAERRNGHGALDAVEIAAETAGHSVLVSGCAVLVAMFGMYLTGSPVFASLATGSVIVVAVAVLGSLTVLPALLVKLGRTIDRPRVPVLWRLTAETRAPRLWPALLRPALRAPRRTLAVSVLLLVAVAVPAFGMRLHSDSPASLPDIVPAKHTYDRLTAAFPNSNADVQVVVKASAARAGEVVDHLDSLASSVSGSRDFLAASSHDVRASADRTVHVLTLVVPADTESHTARDAVSILRTSLVPKAVHGVDGAEWAVGGQTAQSVDVSTGLSDRMPLVIGFVVVLTMLIMGWVFRSVVIALVTAFVNLLSAGAAFGVLVLVFQKHWAEGLLGFHSTGALINWIPLFTFAVLFGLSMDYHVFVVSRIREAAMAGRSTRDAVRDGIVASAGTVTSAALVMVAVFSIFAGLHLVEMKELGVGLAVAVLVDAVLIRTIVLPSLMVLLGRWNWWPGRLPSAPVDRPQRELVPA